jgi:hypothetical protein
VKGTEAGDLHAVAPDICQRDAQPIISQWTSIVPRALMLRAANATRSLMRTSVTKLIYRTVEFCGASISLYMKPGLH